MNPVAGNGEALKYWEEFKKGLEFSYELKITSRANEATEFTRECTKSEGDKLVIAFGGDGTAHEVIAGTLGCTTCIVGVIGAGSGNDFGRGYHSFKTPSELNQYVRASHGKIAMDIGNLRTKQQDYYFVNNSGIGFDAYIAFLVNKSPMKKFLNKFGLGKFAYTYYLIQTLITFNRFHLTVETDTEFLEFQHVWFATVSNQPFFGGGMNISPISDTSDGLIEVTIVNDLSRIKLLLVFITVFFGTHTKFKEVYQIQAKSFSITTNSKVFRHTDGEFSGQTSPGEKDYFTVQEGNWYLADLNSLDVSDNFYDNRYAK